MNCKPGDMAVAINGGPLYENMIFEVISLAPVGVCFKLPDGYMHDPASTHPSWIIKAITPIPAPVNGGSKRLTVYGVGADSRLRPIRPPETPVTETRDEELTV